MNDLITAYARVHTPGATSTITATRSFPGNEPAFGESATFDGSRTASEMRSLAVSRLEESLAGMGVPVATASTASRPYCELVINTDGSEPLDGARSVVFVKVGCRVAWTNENILR